MAGLAARPALWLSIGAIATVPLLGSMAANPRASLARTRSLLGLRQHQPGSYWRLLAILLALVNLKSLPFAWHFRLVRALLRHVSLFRSHCPPAPPLPALFAPIITRTRCSLLEMDYNMHKSNSTYFSDLDISRMHLVTCLMKRGLHKLHFKSTSPLLPEQKPGRFGIYFGGVQCSFRREIKPGASVEIWTRVLTWDRKWLYLISHFVEAGVEQPTGYWLQPWKNGSRQKKAAEAKDLDADARAKRAPNKAIYATAISKYVFKQGRITIPPELALHGAELLPPKSPANTSGVADGDTDADADADEEGDGDADLGPPLDVTLESWDWAAVERERRRGLRLARHMSALDDAVLVFSGGEGMALGEY